MVEYTITDNNIHIVDSYKVPKARFAPELEHIRLYHPRNAVLVNRSITSLSLGNGLPIMPFIASVSSAPIRRRWIWSIRKSGI